MRVDRLRATLQRLVLAAAPVAAAGCGIGGDPCVDDAEKVVVVSEPPPAALEALVRACEAEPDECIALCNRILLDTEGYEGATGCEVIHRADEHEVRIGYEVATGASGCPVPGRRPHGLRAARGRAGSACGAWLGRAAHLEAASVHAFVRLARELAVHGAPARLRRAALAAAHDEARHAAIMGRLARAHGAAPPAVEVTPLAERALEALAVDNVEEGQVGETWAALTAAWQARHAADPEVRAAMRGIAADEARHAALSWRVQRWASERLDDAGLRRVADARRRAVASLVARVSEHEAPRRELADDAAARALGLPDLASRRALAWRARGALWA